MKKSNLYILALMFLLNITVVLSQVRPKVWIISDGFDNSVKVVDGKTIGETDDVSAIASYILMSNNFDTRGIVVASSGNQKLLSKCGDQAEWADSFFGEAYRRDLPNLNKMIGGYQDEIPFYESFLKRNPTGFDPSKSYESIENFSSLKALFELVDSSDDIVNIMCWGMLTEPAIFVKHCKSQGRSDILAKCRFIAHWTSSNFHVGTIEHPEKVHNCFNSPYACEFLKREALNGAIKYYECGAIGEKGIVEGSPRGRAFYDQFKTSGIGKIYVEGKYIAHKDCVDGSDCATYWVLIGDWGVSLNDIASNGLNFPDVEMRNEKAFFNNSPKMSNELLRRSRIAAGE